MRIEPSKGFINRVVGPLFAGKVYFNKKDFDEQLELPKLLVSPIIEEMEILRIWILINLFSL